MNTLPRQITCRFFPDEAAYQALISHWAGLVNDRVARKELTSAHHLLYLLLRGKDWRKGFSSCTNRRKLENGQRKWGGAARTIRRLHNPSYEEQLLAPFRGFVCQASIPLVRHLVPKDDRWEWDPDMNAMDAYTDIPEEVAP